MAMRWNTPIYMLSFAGVCTANGFSSNTGKSKWNKWEQAIANDGSLVHDSK